MAELCRSEGLITVHVVEASGLPDVIGEVVHGSMEKSLNPRRYEKREALLETLWAFRVEGVRRARFLLASFGILVTAFRIPAG